MDLLDRIQGLPFAVVHLWGYVFVFLAAFLEPLPLLGFVIPGQTIVMLAGFFARLGTLDVFVVAALAAVAAFLGDLVSYLLGRRYGKGFLLRYGKRFLFKPQHYEKVWKLLHDHPGKTVIFGRFNSLTRCLAPFVAGAAELPLRRFLPFNVMGALVWAALYATIGYFFGQGYLLASRYIGLSVFLVLVVLVIFAVGYRRVLKFAAVHGLRLSRMPIAWLSAFSLFLFAWIMDAVTDKGALVRLDVALAAAIPGLWQPTVTVVALTITELFHPIVFTLVCIGVFLLLRPRKQATFFALTMLLAFVARTAFKVIVARVRPSGLLVVPGGSFPSGHATMAAAFCAFLIWALWPVVGRWRWPMTAAFTLLALLVGLSRLYLEVHWLSDVLAGWLLGLATFAVALLGVRLLEPWRAVQKSGGA